LVHHVRPLTMEQTCLIEDRFDNYDWNPDKVEGRINSKQPLTSFTIINGWKTSKWDKVRNFSKDLLESRSSWNTHRRSRNVLRWTSTELDNFICESLYHWGIRGSYISIFLYWINELYSNNYDYYPDNVKGWINSKQSWFLTEFTFCNELLKDF